MLVVTVGRGGVGVRLGDVDFALMISELADCVKEWEQVGPPDSRALGVTDFYSAGEQDSCVMLWLGHNTVHPATDDLLARFAREYGVPLFYSVGETFFA